MALVAAFVAIVLIMQWLMHVADEVNNVLQRLSFGQVIRARVFQDREELHRSCGHEIAIRALVGHVARRVSERDTDVMPGTGLAMFRTLIIATLVQ